MPEYRKTANKPVEHKPTKYDGFKLIKTEHPYKHQKGSGRQQAFELAKDGMTVGAWAKLAAAAGYDSKFVVGSLLKLQGAKEPGWRISEKNDKGLTLAEVKKVRDEDPTKKAARLAKLEVARQAKETKKAEKAKAAADKKAATSSAAAAAKTAATGATGNAGATAPTKGKGKGKQPTTAAA